MSIHHALLALVVQEPTSAAGLADRFEKVTNSTWELNIGQVYQTLKRLERDGEVGSEEHPQPGSKPQRIYTATEKGKDTVRSWLYEHTVLPAQDEREDLVIKLVLAAVLEPETLLEVVDKQRAATLARLKEITITKTQVKGAHKLLAEYHIFRLEADMRWLDMVEDAYVKGTLT